MAKSSHISKGMWNVGHGHVMGFVHIKGSTERAI